MRYLLDVNFLIAAILDSHTQYAAADKWLAGKSLATCPLCETGFLRIVTHPKIYGVPMPVAREALSDFISRYKSLFLPDDLNALKSSAHNSEQVTDFYLAELAAAHQMRLATFDSRISHRAVEIIS
ncbi:MAG: PIN domain-containing protein [Verrucomicrobiota bacterium]|jgi:predicted nucleic acid-binding protein